MKMENEVRLIDANALIEDVTAAEENAGMGAVVAGTLRRYVDRRPTIDPESLRPTGKWLNKKWDNIWQSMTATCSHCGVRGEVRYKTDEYGLKVINSPSCPNCGAKMEG